MEDRIEVVEYDPRWLEEYARERDALAGLLGLAPECFRHIGSTAIQGLAAKPTIDLMIGVEPLRLGEAQIRKMESAGYTHLGEFGIPGREFFKKGEPRTHHVHWVRRDADFWTKQLVFREYLRATPEARRPYVELKRDLARKFAHDRAAYTKGKGNLISHLQEQAWRWAGAGLVVFDLEATCWKGGQPFERMETIEIGAVKVAPSLETGEAFTTFVRPKDEPTLTEFCVQLTSIKQADVDAAWPFPAALEAFADWAGDGLYRLASWGEYDLAQLKADAARNGTALPARLERHIDLREMYAMVRGIPPCSMAEALEREWMPREGTAHRGVDDARNAARLARLMLSNLRKL